MNREAVRITDLQRRILSELERNGRLSFRELGKRLGFSAPTIAGNLHDLETSGVIQKFTMQLNFEKMGFMLRAIICLSVTMNEDGMSAAAAISGIPQVVRYHRVTGMFDFYVEVAAVSLPDLGDAVAQLNKIGKTQTSVVMESWEDASRYLSTAR